MSSIEAFIAADPSATYTAVEFNFGVTCIYTVRNERTGETVDCNCRTFTEYQQQTHEPLPVVAVGHDRFGRPIA